MRILCAFIAVFLAFASAAHSQVLIMNTANDPPNSTDDYSGICDIVMTEAFKRIGIKLEIVNLPSERALINANEGIDDGNYARIEGLEKTYPNLIRVPEEITRFEFSAFSKNVHFKPTGWDSLAPYNVGIITGWKILETNITNAKSLTQVKDETLLFNLLAADRVDVVVYERMQGKYFLNNSGMKNIVVLIPPLTVKSMYPYLHKKHKELVPKLAEALKSMKKDGTYAKIVDGVLKSLSLKK
ncbi:MAG: transporter substrate-binding domain-containing protein [Nitrospirae bacterium]|nr:transporter substrate-binding domain-containing protein [Nitrospirota bacterium]